MDSDEQNPSAATIAGAHIDESARESLFAAETPGATENVSPTSEIPAN